MTRTLLLAVLCRAAPAGSSIEIRTAELPWAALHTAYDLSITTQADPRCPDAEIILSLLRGALPEGLELTRDGIHGTPRVMGTFPFTLRAGYNCAQTTRDFVLVVTGKPVLRVDANELVFEHYSGAPNPPPRSILVSSSWPSLPYSVTNAACQWLKVMQTEGHTPPAESALFADPVWVRVQTSDLAPGRYSCNLVFSTRHAANAPVVRVRLEVIAPAAPAPLL